MGKPSGDLWSPDIRRGFFESGLGLSSEFNFVDEPPTIQSSFFESGIAYPKTETNLGRFKATLSRELRRFFDNCSLEKLKHCWSSQKVIALRPRGFPFVA